MVEELVTGASKEVLDAGVIGAVCLLLIAALIVIIRLWRLDLARWEAKLEAEQQAHQETRLAWLADVKAYATIGESVRDQIKPLVTTYNTMLDFYKDQAR